MVSVIQIRDKIKIKEIVNMRRKYGIIGYDHFYRKVLAINHIATRNRAVMKAAKIICRNPEKYDHINIVKYQNKQDYENLAVVYNQISLNDKKKTTVQIEDYPF